MRDDANPQHPLAGGLSVGEHLDGGVSSPPQKEKPRQVEAREGPLPDGADVEPHPQREQTEEEKVDEKGERARCRPREPVFEGDVRRAHQDEGGV